MNDYKFDFFFINLFKHDLKMPELVKIKHNICFNCNKKNLKWHYKSKKSSIEVFSCGHFVCKKCFSLNQNKCNLCKFNKIECNKNTTMSEWEAKNKKKIYFKKRHYLSQTKIGVLYYNLLDEYCDYKYKKEMKKARKITTKLHRGNF